MSMFLDFLKRNPTVRSSDFALKKDIYSNGLLDPKGEDGPLGIIPVPGINYILGSDPYNLSITEWVLKNSTKGLTNVLDFSQYNKIKECWSLNIDGKEIINPTLETIVYEYNNYLNGKQ